MAGGANWFIGLPVAAEALPAGVIDTLPAGLRRLHPDDLHITVAFLGPVGERRALTAWAETEAIDAGPFALRTGTPAALGRPRRPSAYGLDLLADETFVHWMAHWRDRLRAAADVEPETRSVRPHVTLARPPRTAGPAIQQRARAWLDNTEPEAASLLLDRIVLYTSSDGAGPQRYRWVRQRTLPARTGSGPEADA